MILVLLAIESAKHTKKFIDFNQVVEQRYGPYLTQKLSPYNTTSWYTGVKPYHSSIFPFLAMDMFIHFQAAPCKFFFGHDLLPYSTIGQDIFELDETVTHELERVIELAPPSVRSMRFQGFGNRIDTGLNALAMHFVHILGSLTKVEAKVLSHLRALQFETFGDPLDIRTFGLQKLISEKLDKSPVAVHKSLRSSKYQLVASTAVAMQKLMG
jgi:hypothetical protein